MRELRIIYFIASTKRKSIKNLDKNYEKEKIIREETNIFTIT